MTEPVLSSLTPPGVRNSGESGGTRAGGKTGTESHSSFPRATERSRNSEYSHPDLSANSVKDCS